ncbi:MAG TPA: HEAT repeat domain-containing protein [Gemmatimonadales bacterium]|nr:HEAT repeat domain-containing protein [Gemmatimonadales bacterium]
MSPSPIAVPGMLATAALLASFASAGAQGAAARSYAAAPVAEARSYAAAVRAAYAARGAVAAPRAAQAPGRLPEASLRNDPADSLYRAARAAMQRSQFQQAAEMMRALRSRYPKSGYVADSYYWEAYALSRLGSQSDLRAAVAALEYQARHYPKAATKGDARTLEAELNARLARRGDAEAAERVARVAGTAATPPVPPAAPVAPVAGTPGVAAPRPPRTPGAAAAPRADTCGEDDDVQAAALNGLMQMDASRAMPVLRKVLARRDPGSECLRRRAVFIVAQQADDAAPILLETARTDPDAEVRGQAVFWLSQVNSEAAVVALDSIVRQSKDAEVREKAVYALAQQDSPRAMKSLRDLASSTATDPELRNKAVFWIGQRDDAESRAFLRDLYHRTGDAELKDKIIFSVSDDEASRPWLLGIIRDPKEPMEARKRALFWAGQKVSAKELGTLGAQLTEPELREQWVFALAQSDEPAALDRLIEVARSDKDREMRKKAIFWIGQSDDPRAADVLAKILTGEK